MNGIDVEGDQDQKVDQEKGTLPNLILICLLRDQTFF